MALKIRLRRMGRRNAPTYRIVVAESSMPRDGRFVESIGHYNPRTEPLTLVVDRDKALRWIDLGATPTDTVQALLKRAGVYRPVEESLVGGVAETAKSTVKKAAGAVKGAATRAAEVVKDVASDVRETVVHAAEEVREVAADAVEKVRGGGDEAGETASADAASADATASADEAPAAAAAGSEEEPKA